MGRLLAAAVFLLCALPATGAPQPGDIPTARGKVVTHGLYRGYGESPDQKATRTAAGRTTQHDEYEHLQTTTRVPLKLDAMFGFEYELTGLRPTARLSD